MAVNVDRDWLVKNGVDPGTLDRLLREGDPGPGKAPVLAVPGLPRLVRATKGPGRWEATFADWRPSSKNLKSGGRWGWAKARKHDDGVVALWRDHPDGPPEATAKRWVCCRIERKRAPGRMIDPQNIEESLYDSLVANGLLVDDSSKWCGRGETLLWIDRTMDCAVRTTIRLEEH